jgi:hypothetical protein
VDLEDKERKERKEEHHHLVLREPKVPKELKDKVVPHFQVVQGLKGLKGLKGLLQIEG